MEPTNNRFGGGSTDTLLHPLIAVVLCVTIILIFIIPRRHLLLPLLLSIFLIPKSQVVLFAGLHFTVARIICLSVLARILVARASRRGMSATGMTTVDRLFVAWHLIYLVNFSVQWMEPQAFIKACGDLLDACAGYFVLRLLIQDKEDITRAIRVLGVIAAIAGVCMINEQITGANIFEKLGGMPPTTIRDGRIRSQASFAVFLTAGAFGSTLPPLLLWLWPERKQRPIALLGLLGATAMTITCHASTSLTSYVAGLVGLCCWPLRRSMRVVRWGIVGLLLTLHLVMNGPVWSIIEKIDLTGSSSSYHRYMLIDNFIRHWDDWILIGFRDYDKWGFTMWDLGNQYVAEGLTGGVVAFGLFIWVITRSFGSVGAARRRVSGNRREEWRLWCIGSALFAHVISNFGIGYFDQVAMAWYAVLCVIAASVTYRGSARKTVETPDDRRPPTDAALAMQPA